jgi:hypothetical protein
MKSTIIIFCLLISLMGQAQIAPLQDHNWQLEKIVIDNEETLAEPDYNASGDDWAKINFSGGEWSSFLFVDLGPSLTYNDENSSFTIYAMTVLLGEYHGAETSQIFEVPFIANEDVFEDWNNPFTYSFRDEAELLYLEITNANGDVATFFTTTLSNTNFEKAELTIYPNPTSNLLHIETNQTDITAVEIFKLLVKRLKQVSLVNETNINVSVLTNGVYFLKIDAENGQVTRKFVKK